MYKNKKILAVIPARGGSKGVPLKNIRPLAGKPLIAYTGEVVAALPEIDRAVVSTDHAEIARAAEACGLAAPFFRPESLSGDRIADWDVLDHALRACEELDGARYDLVVMLQPTSPLRRPAHVRACIEKLVDGGWDAVWTVSTTDIKFHPLKQLKLGEDGRMGYFDPAGSQIIARQQLQPVYHRNGVAYAITRDCLLEQKSILGARASAVVVDEELANIDTLEDFEKAERLVRAREGGAC